MKKSNLKNIIYSCALMALLAIGCTNNNQKSVTDGNDNIENLSDNEYDLKATTSDKSLEVEQDVIDRYKEVPDSVDYELTREDLDLDDKNDLPTAKVVRDEKENQ